MAHEIGFVDNTGTEGIAHWQMLLKIKTFAEANGWTTLRYLNPTPYTDKTVIRELILQGVGLSGTEQIFIGFRAYQDQTSDYYNLTTSTFTGYVAGNAFTAQPGYTEFGLCAHNVRIDYWLLANAQRIAFVLKVGAPSVYEQGYAGKYFPFATPGQYPYPVVCSGTIGPGMPATRYSDTSYNHRSGLKGYLPYPAGPSGVNYCAMLRDIAGTWRVFRTHPFTDDQYRSPAARRDTGSYYCAIPITLMSGSIDGAGDPAGSPPYDKTDLNVLGELDGIRYVSGFGRTSEDTETVGGIVHVLFGDCFRADIGDYFLVEMN